MSDREFRSRLQRSGAPLRGMGSGYAQNQAMAGVNDPEEAARLARMSPAQAEEESARLERLKQDLDAMREDILIAIQNDGFDLGLEKAPTTTEGWKEFLESQPAGTIQMWAKAAQEHLDKAIEEQDEAALRDSILDIGRVDPSDPNYDPITDKDRKKAIEAKLKPLDFEQMVFQGYCTQDVTVRDNFVLTFRTLPTQHGLWLEYMMAQEEETSYQHARHLFSIYQVAATLDSVNGRSMGQDLTKFVKADQRDEFIAAMRERVESVGRMPSVITDDLIVQYIWFTGRVRRMMAGDLLRKVGNS